MSTSTAARLPDDVTEQILERLPLSDYVRFPAVCRRWRSIQTDHRRRHAPSPPPMVRLPWLIPWGSDAETVPCYSPFEGRTYHIKIPEHARPYGPSGWILCSDSIFNPISGIHIPFPEPLADRHEINMVVVSPPPSLVVFVLKNRHELFFFRPGDTRWTELLLPLAENEIFAKFMTVGERLYFTSSSDEKFSADHLLIVDPVHTPPMVCSYWMQDWVKTLPEGTSVDWWLPAHLVESDGELLMVKQIHSGGPFHLLRPNVSKRIWTRVESLGDRLLIFHTWSAVSLLAADVGFKKNCIYFNDHHRNWKVFDLGVGMVMDASFPDDQLLRCNLPNMFMLRSHQPNMFLPSIC